MGEKNQKRSVGYIRYFTTITVARSNYKNRIQFKRDQRVGVGWVVAGVYVW